MSLSATTSVRVPTSSTSAKEKPWLSETERMPSLPSRLFIRTTYSLIGGTEVRYCAIMRQS